MMPDFPTARLNIDLNALLANYRVLQARARTAEVAPVVKADAYGLGCEAIATHLAKNGARTFFVARLDEGITLRRHIGAGPIIYVLDGLIDGAALLASDLRPVINSPQQYQQWIAGSTALKAALHIDTGMNRLGIAASDIVGLPAHAGHSLTLVMSHLACADDPRSALNAQQLIRFMEAAAQYPGIPRSLANSAGSFLDGDYDLEMTRPGISLYGGGPFGVSSPEIQAVATLKARILQVRDVAAGETVGYGAAFKAREPMRVATLGIGYADGLLRSFGGRGFAFVAGERRNLAGRISMDLCCVDVTGLDVSTNDCVELLGPNQSIDEVAQASGTIAYELLTRIATRVQRHYK